MLCSSKVLYLICLADMLRTNGGHMLITKIEKQKNNQKRYSIYIDGEYKFALSGEDVLYFKFNEGMEIEIQRYHYIMEYVIYTKAKDKAYKYLGYKQRTQKELTDKLIQQQYPEEIIERVVQLFKGYGYINDHSYAQYHINNRVRFKPMAKKMIKYELAQKGISGEIIDSTIEASCLNELDMATQLLQKKVKSQIAIDEKDKKRAYNYLLRRGFNFDTINKAFKIVFNDSFID